MAKWHNGILETRVKWVKWVVDARPKPSTWQKLQNVIVPFLPFFAIPAIFCHFCHFCHLTSGFWVVGVGSVPKIWQWQKWQKWHNAILAICHYAITA